MKIDKNTLNKLIEVYREFWATDTNNSKKLDTCLSKINKVSHELEVQTGGIMRDVRFRDLVSIYVRCDATNEIIYKAIDLLGIKIE